ncbi:MAG: hypothetical protein ABSG31_14930 [Tepidisphaeraceae bacterium]
MRHVLCAYLRHWPIDRLRRRRRELRRKPLVLIETSGNRQTIVHVSPETPADIYPGMALAAARARDTEVLDFPATPVADLRALEAMGYWLMGLSPGVCVYPPSSLFLDATGLERLYGGLENFRRRVAQALASLRVTAAVTIAPTPGAAWALAAFGKNGSRIVTNEQVAIESLDAIYFAVQELTRQIAAQLTARGQGARELRLTFRQPYASPVEKVIRLVRPCRNESALMKLICCAIENLEASEGFVAATLAVVATERLGDEQAALIGGEEERDAAELDHLVERLRARLDRGVEWGELLESNLPENASRCRDTAGKPDAPSARGAVDLLRPLRLLRQPRSIKTIVRPSESRDGEPVSFTDYGEVHRLDHIRGPERITGQWWNGRWKTRDYFDVLDTAGDRYWIFRVAQSGLWFLHGIFE